MITVFFIHYADSLFRYLMHFTSVENQPCLLSNFSFFCSH